MMVDVVTHQAAEAQNAETVQAAETAAAEEMATAAQEAAVTETPAEEEAPGSEQQQWDDILVEDEGMPDDATPGLENLETTTEEVIAPVETPEDVTPAETPTAEEETPPEEAAVEATPSEVPVPEVPAPQETRTPEEVQVEITQARKTAKDKLRESFTWTEEQETQFQENPGAVMSEMAADLFLDIYDSVSQGLQAQMPGMVQGILRQQESVQAAEKQFYGAWPQLAKAEYRETVDRIATTYRQQFPTTDNETAITEIGAQAWVALRLPLDELVALTQKTPPSAAAPVITPTHVPASAGNTVQAAHAPAKAPMNEFEQLATELLLDDE